MKKRIIALLLCVLAVFTSIPVAPGMQLMSIDAVAASVSIAELQKVFEQAPGREEWDNYINGNSIKYAYEKAEEILANPSSFSQSKIDEVTADLAGYVKNLKPYATAISVGSNFSLSVGKTKTIKATLTPSNAGGAITWTSSDPQHVGVTQDGVVSVLGYTSTPVEIRADITGKGGTVYSAKCYVTTVNPVAGVTLSESSVTLYQGQEKKLVATLTGLDATAAPNGSVYKTWDSNNTTVAEIDDAGLITAKGVGSCLITCTVKNEEGKTFIAECTVKVTKLVPVEELQVASSLVDGKIRMTCGTEDNLKILVLPTDASIKELSWTTSDKSIVSLSGSTVSTGGFASVKLKANKAGTAKITFTAKDGSGIKGTVTVEVLPLISSLKLSATTKSITVDAQGEKIGVTISPSNAGNQKLNWFSSNEKICKVDYNGVLYPVASGECYIRVATTDGSDIVEECRVVVSQKAKSVKVNKSTAKIENGSKLNLYATVTTADNKTHDAVVWSSSNTKIATVTQDGVVTAKYPGEVAIKATAADGTGLYDICTVTVTQKITGITLKEAITVAVGKTATLTATTEPSYATDTTLVWKSNNTAVATVNASGVVTGKNVGTAKITCENIDGSAVATCTVSVVIPATGISLSSASEELWAGESVSLKATVTPSNATDKSVTWSSSNTKVAKVTNDGLVVAVAGGSCVITAKNSAGQKASCYIDVFESVSGVELSTKAKSMYVGEVSKITATVYPTTATNKKVTWSSSNTSVATVSSSGEIKALKTGTASIKVKTSDGGYTATCTVTVHSKVSVTGVSLDRNSVTVKVGKTYQLVNMISPSNASETGVTWSTDNSKVATVSSKGVVKGIKAGSAIITVKTKDGGYTAKCKVTVVQPVTGVTLGTSNVKLAVGKSKALTWNVFPEDATDSSVKWSSSDTSVATVSKGVVTAKKSGTAVITVTTVDGGYKATCNFTVYVPVTGVKVAASTLKIPKGQSRMIYANIIPSNATNKSVSWTSSNTSVAKVNEAGQITAVSKGTAKITCKTADGAYKATCVVTVVQLVESIKLDASTVSLKVGKTKTITARVSPSTATYTSVKWKSSNTKIATVDSNGTIKAVSAGTATIKALSLDGNAEATCRVNVVQPVKSIKLDKTSAVVKVGKLLALKATVLPANASNKKVIWSSANTKRAKVSEDGVVKGLTAGYVNITAKTVDGGFVATCKVLVAKSVTGIKLDKTTITMNIGKSTTITPTVTPSDATIKTVSWSSDNRDVVTVDSKGKVTAVGQGYATITAKTKDGGYTAKASVLVVKPVTGVTLNKTSAYLNIGSTMTLVAKVAPSDATIQSVTWTSSNPAVATVNSAGLVKGIKKGVTTISCMTNSGKKVATCKISVVKRVTKVTLNETKATLYLGDTLKLESTVYPVDATVKDVTYSTSNKSVAVVNANGLVTPLNLGRAVITVTTKDGSLKASCVVTVKKAPESIKLGAKSATLKVGQSVTLKYAIYPADATNRTATFSSSNTKVATVSSSGVIKAVSRGEAYITASTENGIKARCKITVTQPVKGVEIDPTVTVYTGKSVTPYASVLPKNANNNALTWKSSDTSVAKVTSKGVITGIKAGKATITVASAENAKLKATCVVTVKQHVTSVTFDEREVYINKGAEADLKYTVLPKDASDKKVTFKSSDSSVVSVSNDGHITARKGGRVSITVTSTDNTKATAICYVTVVEPATGVSLNYKEKTVYVGDKLTLKATVSPSDAHNKLVRWSSDDAARASVDSKGVVTALKSGTVTITATTVDGGYTASCKLTLLQRATSIKLESTKLKINRGETIQLNASVLPEDCYNKAYVWSSADTSIATVTEQGFVTTVAPGVVKLTCKSLENEKVTATVTLTVHEPVTEISLAETEATLYTPLTKQLTVNLLPLNASDKSVTWTSSDKKVLTVDKNGKVTAVGKGEATVTAKSNDTGITAECKFTILTGVEEIVTGKDSYSFRENNSYSLDYSIRPAVVDDPRLTFTSSDESVFTVDEEGRITGIAPGEAELTITSVQNPEVKKVVKIKITRPVTSVSLDAEEKTIFAGKSFTLTANVLPADATDRTVKWTSSDTKVVTVSDSGEVTAVARGFAEITATTVDGSFKAVCRVEVIQLPEKVMSSADSYTVYMGKTLTLDMSVMPENANDTSLRYSSSDEAVATVDEKGVVTPVKTGSCVITAASSLEGVEKKVTVNVVQLCEEIFFPIRVRDLRAGEKLRVFAQALPETTTDKRVAWTSSDEKVATIDEYGVITAVSSGEVKITATSLDIGAVKNELTVRVVEDISGISFGVDAKTVELGEELTLKAEVLPEFAYDKSVTYTSSDEKVATVDKNGKVKAVGIGKAVISAKTADGKFTAKVTVTVIKAAQSVQLGRTEFELEKGERVKLQYQVLPVDTTQSALTFTSSDEKVAVVSPEGVITAMGKGTAKITITVTGTKISAVITVKVL